MVVCGKCSAKLRMGTLYVDKPIRITREFLISSFTRKMFFAFSIFNLLLPPTYSRAHGYLSTDEMTSHLNREEQCSAVQRQRHHRHLAVPSSWTFNLITVIDKRPSGGDFLLERVSLVAVYGQS